MKIIKAIRVLLVASAACWGLTGFSQTTNSFFQFVQDQSERRYSNVPHEVLAVYYVWYGAPPGNSAWGQVDTNKHEIERTARYPVKGAYNSHDTTVMDWQIDQAKAHGITGFVVSWFGRGSWHDRALALLIGEAEKKDFKVSVYWETDEGHDQINVAIEDLSYLLTHYGKSKAFLKVDGKPVIFFYGRISSQLPISAWPEVIQKTRQQAGDFLLVADGYQDGYAYLFDGIHSYDLTQLPSDLGNNLRVDTLGNLRSWAAQYYKNGVKMARQRGRISCLMVMPGFDARKAYTFNTQMDRLDGQTYWTLWEEAIKANPDWIFIKSWNEWPEGTEIEPSLELGDKYLQITTEYAKPFINSATVAALLPSNSPPPFAPGTTNELDKILAGRKIGVLIQDQMNDSEFWAAYCGATLQRLTWQDLIDSKVFNADNFSVLVCITGEHYTSSVKVTDDVTESLVHYLHQGGLLLSVSTTGPWPFNYDDSRKGIPFGITDKLVLGVDNGFEQPPAGAELKFYVNKSALSGLPPTAPFPVNGDLRFRPASRSHVPSYDYYLPLVQLWDAQMHFQGDAAVYIQHNAAPLSPGKSLYVWMRTAEALGPDEFYPSLYQFISTKLKPLPTDK